MVHTMYVTIEVLIVIQLEIDSSRSPDMMPFTAL